MPLTLTERLTLFHLSTAEFTTSSNSRYFDTPKTCTPKSHVNPFSSVTDLAKPPTSSSFSRTTISKQIDVKR